MDKVFLIVCFFCLQLLMPHSIFNTMETDMVSKYNYICHKEEASLADGLFYGITANKKSPNLFYSFVLLSQRSYSLFSFQNEYQETTVSWYGKKFEGRKTASGKIFRAKEISAAHKSLPFGSLVLFVNPKNKKSLIVEINDRGPFVKGRDFDLSKKAAELLGVKKAGVKTVLSRIVYVPLS